MGFLSNVKMVLTTSCDRSSRLLSDELERPLSRTERTALRFHLVLCRHCRRFRRNIRHLRAMLGHLTTGCMTGDSLLPSLPASSRVRIAQAVTRAQGEDS